MNIVMKRVMSLLLAVVMTVGMVIPAGATDVDSMNSSATIVVETVQETHSGDSEGEQQPTASEPTPSPVVTAEPTDDDEQPASEADAVQTAVPEDEPLAAETPIGDGDPAMSTPAVATPSSTSEGEGEENAVDQDKVDEFIGSFLVADGVKYPIDPKPYKDAGEAVPSVYFEVTEANYEQILEAEDSWTDLKTAEQDAVNAVICAAYISFLISEAEEAAAEGGYRLAEAEIEEIEATEDVPTFKAMVSDAYTIKAEVVSRAASEMAEEEAVEEVIEYSDMTAEEFISLYLLDSEGNILAEVSAGSYEFILMGEEDWAVLAPEQKALVNNALTNAVTSSEEDEGRSEGMLIDFADLLVGAQYFADHAEELSEEDQSLEDALYSGILADEGVDYVLADVFTFDEVGNQIYAPVSFTSDSIALLGDSNFGFDTDSSLILDKEKFQDQDSDLIIDPHYGSVQLTGTQYYIDWYDNKGNYWGMNARYVDNIFGRDQFGNEHQVFCVSPARKFYDTNINKAAGWDWNSMLSESQRKAIALTCLYGTNGNEYLQSAAQVIIFELVTKYRSSTDFARQYKTWHSIVNGLSVWEKYVEKYYLDLPYQLYLHGSSPSWMFDTHDDAVAGTYDLTKNASTGNYEITLANTDSKINGSDARKKDWVNRFEYTAYADKDYTTEITGITFTSKQNTSSATKASITISVPEDIYNKYGEIYIKVKTPSLKTSEADFRLWIPNSSSTTAGQTFIELVSGEGEPAYAYMTLRAGGDSNEFDLTVNKVAPHFVKGITSITDGIPTIGYKAGYPLTGVTFGLYEATDANSDGVPDTNPDGTYVLGDLISQQEVDADAKAVWTALNAELKYILVEESAPLQFSASSWENGQYLIDNTVNKEKSIEITAENNVRPYSFSIAKKDLSTDSFLAGVTFGLYNAEAISCYDLTGAEVTVTADTLMGKFTTGDDSSATGNIDSCVTSNGVTTVTVSLPAGTYYIKELSAPDGYEIDSSEYTVIDYTGDEVTVDILDTNDDTIMCSQFQILELYNKHTFDITVTKYATSYGVITTNTTTGATFGDPSNRYSTSVAYYDANVTFGLYESVDDNGDGAADTNADGSYVLGTLIGKQAVNSSGKVNWTGLDDSKVYVLKEVEADLMYSAFEFDAYESDPSAGGANGHGEILIDNRTYRDSSVAIEINDWIRPLTFSIEKKGADTGEYLAGATFGIYTAETITWKGLASGSIRTYAMPEDTLVGTFTTPDSATSSAVTSSSPLISVKTTNGVTTVTMGVPIGKYYIKEISAPSGYELDETEYIVVDFAGDETTTEIVDHTGFINGWTGIGISNAGALSTQNGPQTIINKVPDKEYFDLVVNKLGNGITGISGYGADGATSGYTQDYKTSLSDLTSIAALFRLYEAVDDDGDGVADLDADGYYELGTLVSEQWTDNEAKLYWYGLDKEKQYVLHEVAAPNNYNKPNFLGNRILITPDDSTVTYEVDANDGSSYMYLSIRKLDEETNKPIQGAVFGVYMGEDMYVPGSTTSIAVPKDTLLVTGTTNADGYIWGLTDRAILPGYQYYIKEISVPDGWELDSTPYYLEVYEDHVTYDMMVNTGTNTWDHWTTTYFNNSYSYYFYNDPSDPVYYPFYSLKLNERLDTVSSTDDGGVSFDYVDLTSDLTALLYVIEAEMSFVDVLGEAKYAVYAAEDIYDAQGDLVYSSGDRVTVYYGEVNNDPTLGDVNMDGVIDTSDADIILRFESEALELSDEQLRRADVSGDSEVTSADASIIMQYNAFLIDSFTLIKESDTVTIGFPNGIVYWVQNPGTYYVEEIEAPYGLIISDSYTDDDDNTFTIESDATSYTAEDVVNLGPSLTTNVNDNYTNVPDTLEVSQGFLALDFADKVAFRVYKIDGETKQPLSGATFGLYAATDYSAVLSKDDITSAYVGEDGKWHYTANYTTVYNAGDLIATATSGTDGYAVFDVDVPTNDPNQSFYIMEISAPANYNKSYESWGPYSVKELLGETINDGISTVSYANNTHTYTVTYENAYAGYGNIYIEKTGDELVGVTVDEDGNTQFKYTQTFLEDAQFSVYAAETIYGRDGSVEYNEGDVVRLGLTTNADGVIFVENVPFGKYIVKEENAPYGFVTVLSTEYSGYVPGVDLLNSDDSDDGENDSLDSDTIVDEESIVTREEAIEAAKFSAEKEVIIDGSVTLGDYDVYFWDPRQIAKVSVTKLEDGTDTPLAGAVFGLYAEDDICSTTGDVLVSAGELIAKATSGAGGIAEFNVDLPIDHKYCIRELEAPEGYELSDEEFLFEFNYTTQDEAVQEFSYIFYDEPESGILIIHKVGEAVVSAVQNDFYDEEAGWTLTAEESPLAGAVYDIYAASNIYNPATRKVVYLSGAKVKTNVSTDATGKAIVEGLYSGKYRIVEKEAPSGYVISETEKTVTFDSSDASTGTVTFTDERKKMDVVIYKTDAVYDTPLAGAKFALMTSEDVPVGNTVIPAYTIIETAVSGEDGYVNFTMDEFLPFGYVYKVFEIEAPDMYEISDDFFSFFYNANLAIEGGNVFTVSATFENDHGDDWEEPGSITVKKVDTDGNPLEGVKFLLEYSTDNGTTWAPVYYSEEPRSGVYPTGGTTTPVEAGVATTDETGIVHFADLKALEDGSILYRLKETEALSGYQLIEGYIYEGVLPIEDSTKPGGFNYDIEFTVENEWALGSLSVQKVNNWGAKLSGVTYLLEYSLDDGTTWTPVFTADPTSKTVVAGSTTAEDLAEGMLTTTDAANPVVFTDLLCDGNTKYRLTEVKTPDGYTLLAESIFEGYLPVVDDDGEKTFDLAYVVTNNSTFVLPKTGSYGFVIPALASGIGLAGIGGLWLLKKRREDDEDGES